MFSSICGRLCPAPCERACVFYEDKAPISIRALERYAADFGQTKSAKSEPISHSGKKVAVIGSGPAGLTAAGLLVQKGFPVTIFEALNDPGGVLRYGVGEFRLPKKVLDVEIAWLKSLGVVFTNNFLVGASAGLEEIMKSGYSALFLATGAGAAKFLDIPGTHLGGVSYANEFLLRVNILKAGDPKSAAPLNMGQRVAVIGSGYAALDVARNARRLGAEVTVVLRHSEDDMGVRMEEKEYTKEEGIKLEALTKPLAILSNDQHFVRGLQCIRLDFADPKNTGEWQLLEVPSSEFVLEADTVIIAIGGKPHSVFFKNIPNLKINPDQTIWTNAADGMTSIPGIFAGGSITSGERSEGTEGTIVEAMAAGKKAAQAIERYLKK